ncbi:MAG: sulfatase [Opitutales bacterium]
MKLVSLLTLLVAASSAVLHAQQQPNVLFLIVDDLRPELGAYGSEVKTPQMDALAERGQLFSRAYCNVPVCGASRASFMTGIRPGRHRYINYHTRADEHTPDAVPVSQAFQEAGYTTVSYGKVFHNGNDFSETWDEDGSPDIEGTWRNYLLPENLEMDKAPDTRGPAFESYDGDKKYKDELLADMAIARLREFAESGEPFFLATGFVKPHLPFNAPKEYWDLYDPEAIALPDNYERYPGIPGAAYHNFGELRAYSGVPRQNILPEEYARKLIHGYYAATSYVDAQIGRVLDELDALGMRENTVVVLIGDHGYNLGEHTLWCKHCNFDHAMHVPMIWDIPHAPDGIRIDALVEFIDIYPTLLHLTGIDGPQDQLDGTSLVPLIQDPEAEGRGFIISKYHNGISIRTDQYLYTEWQKRNTGETYAQTLFDLHADPMETNNLAEAPTHQETVAELAAMLRANWGEDFEKRR